jgi:hypothetical protein
LPGLLLLWGHFTVWQETSPSQEPYRRRKGDDRGSIVNCWTGDAGQMRARNMRVNGGVIGSWHPRRLSWLRITCPSGTDPPMVMADEGPGINSTR